jgi:phospholipid/cholesterol/gamma-HCH transport system substrate-binding protein
MSREVYQNIRLGIFVLSGLVILIIAMYLLGKNQNLFGSNINLKARFKTISGLTDGNNVRFSGIDAGTVKGIKILDDTTIEINMVINKKLESFIPKNSIADIGNEGLMGNKVVNITPGLGASAHVEDGDMLPSKNELNTGSMLETFSRTNDNVEVISGDLKTALKRINNSQPLWALLEDSSLSREIKATLVNFRKSSENLNSTSSDLHDLVKNIKAGKGVVGELLSDQKEADNLKATLDHLKKVSENTDKLTAKLDSMANSLDADLKNNHGAVQTLLRDKENADKITKSLSNLEQGSATFNQEMQALRQNRFMKKYLKKEARSKQQQSADTTSSSRQQSKNQ